MKPFAAARALAALALMATALPALGADSPGPAVRAGAPVGSAVGSAVRAHPAPVAPPSVVTRPMPPFHRAPGTSGHGHHHGPVVIFLPPPYYGVPPVGYGFGPYSPYFPYSSLRPYPAYSPFDGYSWLYSFGSPPSPMAAPLTADYPYYCWVDGIGFTDEGRFLHHLHEVHGVPLDEARASTELVGDRRVFFGY